MPSRQYLQQEKNVKNGKCRFCPKPLYTKQHCKDCAEKVRVRARNKYRKKVGIPLDSPITKEGRICPNCKEARGLLGLALYVAKNRLLDITNKEHDEAFDKIRAYLKEVGFIEEGV